MTGKTSNRPRWPRREYGLIYGLRSVQMRYHAEGQALLIPEKKIPWLNVG